MYEGLHIFVAEPAGGGLVYETIVGSEPSVCDVFEMEVVVG